MVIQNIQILRNFSVFVFTLGQLEVLTPIIICCTCQCQESHALSKYFYVFAAFFVLFMFASLVQFSNSLVAHCSRTFVLLVRFFLLHMVYLASVLIFWGQFFIALGSFHMQFVQLILVFHLFSLSSCKYLTCFFCLRRIGFTQSSSYFIITLYYYYFFLAPIYFDRFVSLVPLTTDRFALYEVQKVQK